MNLLQSFGKLFAMFIDDEEHRERQAAKQSQQQKPQQKQQHQHDTSEVNATEVDDFESEEMFDEFFHK